MSSSPSALVSLTEHFKAYPGASIDSRFSHLLPWHHEEEHASNLLKWLTSLRQAYPGVSLVGEAGISYLPYVAELAAAIPDARFVCALATVEEVIDDFLRVIAERSVGGAVNHWAEQRTGLNDHPFDFCFPTYPTRDLVVAIRRFHEEYRLAADQLARRYPKRFTLVDVRYLERLRTVFVCGDAVRFNSTPR